MSGFMNTTEKLEANKPIFPGVKIFLVKLFAIRFDVTKLRRKKYEYGK